MRKLSRFVAAAGVAGVTMFGTTAAVHADDTYDTSDTGPGTPGGELPFAGAGMLLPIVAVGGAAVVVGAAINKAGKAKKA